MSMSTKEAAARIGVSPRRVRQYIADGRLEAELAGRDYRIDEEVVEAFERPPQGNRTTRRNRKGRPRKAAA